MFYKIGGEVKIMIKYKKIFIHLKLIIIETDKFDQCQDLKLSSEINRKKFNSNIQIFTKI